MAEGSAAIDAAQKELLASVRNLSPLADHIQSSYAASCHNEGRKEVFANAKTFVAQSLASVAYQVNEVATLMEQLFNQQAQQINELEARLSLPRQQIDMYNEHIGRRSIASLTAPRKSARAKKVVKIRPDEAVSNAVPRMSISYDMFDKVGSGITLEADGQRATAVQSLSQRGHGERLYSVSRMKPKSEADSLVEDIYGSIGTVKSRPPPPAAPGVPRAPSIPTVPNPTGAPLARMASFSAQRPNPPPKPAFITPPAPATPAPAPPAPPPPTPNVHADNFYEDVNLPAANTASENIYQNPADSIASRAAPAAAAAAAPPPLKALFPPPPPPPPQAAASGILGKALALYDYEATQEDELSFQEHEVIEIVAKNSDGWFEGVIGLRRGLFPGNYVQELAESET